MGIARVASFVHKWLALLVGVQILFWVASGFFFTLYPIETIRSEHLVREAPRGEIAPAAFARLDDLRDGAGRAPVKVVVERRATGVVALAEFADGPPILFDAMTLRKLSPLGVEEAVRIAAAHVTLASPPAKAQRVTAPTSEYRGALPAWRVTFKESNLAVYVAANTGQVTARRSDLWRVYDALWALHIMDWRNHEDFNHPLIVGAALLALVSTIAGIVLIPFWLRFGVKRVSPDA